MICLFKCNITCSSFTTLDVLSTFIDTNVLVFVLHKLSGILQLPLSRCSENSDHIVMESLLSLSRCSEIYNHGVMEVGYFDKFLIDEKVEEMILFLTKS
jgi:hypothetical protein